MKAKERKEWSYETAARDAFFRELPMMQVYYKLQNQRPDERNEMEQMLRELGYDF